MEVVIDVERPIVCPMVGLRLAPRMMSSSARMCDGILDEPDSTENESSMDGSRRPRAAAADWTATLAGG